MFTLVSGGAASGKSAYAEELAAALAAPHVYIATMLVSDHECARRVERHRRMRAHRHFATLECPLNLTNAHIPPQSVVLLECLSNLTANECFVGEGFAGAENRIIAGMEHLYARAAHVIVVTNELFCDGVEYQGETQRYLQLLAYLNRTLAAQADCVAEVVCGIPYIWKDVGV